DVEANDVSLWVDVERLYSDAARYIKLRVRDRAFGQEIAVYGGAIEIRSHDIATLVNPECRCAKRWRSQRVWQINRGEHTGTTQQISVALLASVILPNYVSGGLATCRFV